MTSDKNNIKRVAVVLSVFFWLGVMVFAWQQPLPEAQYGVLFLGGVVFIYTINEIFEVLDSPDISGRSSTLQVALLASILAVTVAATAYFYQNFMELYTVRTGYANTMDYVMGTGIVLVIFYLTYREFGVPFTVVILGTLIYAFFGPLFPGIFRHTGLGWERIMQTLATDVEGVYGNLNRLVASWIALFLLYAGLLQSYGAFDLIIRAALRAERYLKSGVAQSAVVASMIIGSVNGSATANTGITGSLTIPLMKKAGLRGETAGGIEAVASTGGQTVPPVMGAAVFLMASILAVPYLEVMLAGILPAIIFYISLVVAVHYAYERDVGGSSRSVDIADEIDTTKSRKQIAYDSAKFIIPFAILIYFIGYRQYTVMSSALYTCLAMIATGVLFPVAQDPSTETVTSVASQTVEGFYNGLVGVAPIAIIIGTINGVVDLLMVTGTPGKLSLFLLDVSGGVFIFALVLSMVICIIMGLGMPTSAAYLVVALLIAPSLINQFGMSGLSAHYFVFYAAILASITPPIATGIAVACGIAEAGFWSTAKQALRIGAPLFVAPFLFAYHPETISSTVTAEYLISGSIGLVSSVIIVYALNFPPWQSRFERFGDISIRAIYVVIAIFAMVYPNNWLRILGLGAIFAVHVIRTELYQTPMREWRDRLLS